MAFSLPDYWVWDFWLADDGHRFHMFFLHAPKSLGDPELRHRNARIGHASSTDLAQWVSHGTVLGPGAAEGFDGTATWTGSVVRGPDGLWRMFYTGSRFLSGDANTNIESVGIATSRNLLEWTKLPGPAVSADRRWYETLGTSSWPEEAFRDPWVFADPNGKGWHMLITARANHGDEAGRGVVGHATSGDLTTWHLHPPLSEPQQGFGHLEVPQLVQIDGQHLLLFCCHSQRLANGLAGKAGGNWIAPARGPSGPFEIDRAYLLAPETLYAARLVRNRQGHWSLMGFEMGEPGAPFPGRISDPLPVVWRDGRLALA
ncbi:MAG: glycoside hydrolase family 68 protein [Devosia sp.]|nr:glycoside hydrolase family 68 protein [Devosia sp.]